MEDPPSSSTPTITQREMNTTDGNTISGTSRREEVGCGPNEKCDESINAITENSTFEAGHRVTSEDGVTETAPRSDEGHLASLTTVTIIRPTLTYRAAVTESTSLASDWPVTQENESDRITSLLGEISLGPEPPSMSVPLPSSESSLPPTKLSDSTGEKKNKEHHATAMEDELIGDNDELKNLQKALPVEKYLSWLQPSDVDKEKEIARELVVASSVLGFFLLLLFIMVSLLAVAVLR